jgi:hypothetical protein
VLDFALHRDIVEIGFFTLDTRFALLNTGDLWG